ncbi:MAG: hypothetical protein DMG46_05430 [Acidobacteria bacterium]|nr:MAG: hypothetical protein DMG46_05430 [Acidobacteriota bacterium]
MRQVCVAGRSSTTNKQLDELRSWRQQVRREPLAESSKHKGSKLLCQIPSIGPIRAALLIAVIQTPHQSGRCVQSVTLKQPIRVIEKINGRKSIPL